MLRKNILHYLFLSALLAGAWGLPTPVSAQESAKVVPMLSSRTLGTGQQAVLSYQLHLSGNSVERFPDIIQAEGLTITFSGQTQRLTQQGGSIRNEVTYRYTVQSDQPGEFTIPAQKFLVGGEELEAPAVTLTVREGDPVDEEILPTVQLSVSKTEFWKGEVVPIQVAILVHPNVQPLSPFFPQIKTPQIAVTRFDRSAGLEAREVNGEIWRAWQMESVMTALQAGAHGIGPAEVKAELMLPLPGMLNDPFLNRPQGRRKVITLTSNVVPVNVKELPMEGRPEGFSGAVGDFQIDVAASPVNVKAGDPIAVEIGVTGTGNFDAVSAPKLTLPDGWRQYDARLSQENRGWGTENGRKGFTQILIPEKNVTVIPAYEVHFFDPVQGKYVSRQSQPVPVIVTGEFKPATDATAESKDYAAMADASAPVEELGDILERPLVENRWLSTAAAPIPVSPWLLHGVPGLLLLLLVGKGAAYRWKMHKAARTPDPSAPREPYAILADLRQQGQDRSTFYNRVNEYLRSVPWHHQRSLPESESMKTLLAMRDRWLYGTDSANSREPLPPAEQQSALEVLRSL